MKYVSIALLELKISLFNFYLFIYIFWVVSCICCFLALLQPQVITVILQVHMHCEACAQEIKRRILKMKGNFYFLLFVIIWFLFLFFCQFMFPLVSGLSLPFLAVLILGKKGKKEKVFGDSFVLSLQSGHFSNWSRIFYSEDPMWFPSIQVNSAFVGSNISS